MIHSSVCNIVDNIESALQLLGLPGDFNLVSATFGKEKTAVMVSSAPDSFGVALVPSDFPEIFTETRAKEFVQNADIKTYGGLKGAALDYASRSHKILLEYDRKEEENVRPDSGV